MPWRGISAYRDFRAMDWPDWSACVKLHEAKMRGFGVSPIQGTDGFNEDSLHDR